MNVVKNNKNPFLTIYVAQIIKSQSFSTLLPKERDIEVSSIKNERAKAEKYTAWKLLEHALLKSSGMKIEDAELYKDSNGKWHSPHFDFSITHSGNAVAVVISHAPVGIDIERIKSTKSDSFAKKNLTESELIEYGKHSGSKKDKFLLTRWCIKEAVFKKQGGAFFSPSSIDSTKESAIVTSFFIDSEEYICAVSAKDSDVELSFDFVENLL